LVSGFTHWYLNFRNLLDSSAYPIEFIENTKIPCISTNHPTNIILLTCDARGVLPPISKLNREQTMFHFISGYTSKMAGTEQGVTEPQATFSSCFAQPFLALHPMRYASMLADKIDQHKASAWLLNTGWVGAGASTGGKRCPLKYTRAILDAIHSGELANVEYENYGIFNLQVPKTCPGVPDELLNPAKSWTAKVDFTTEVSKLGQLFNENFKKYADQATADVIAAGPQVPQSGATTETAKPVEAAKIPQPVVNGTHHLSDASNITVPKATEAAPTPQVVQ
jgi:phosphoenolpyruvate carboxykinase (ATP)